MDPITLNLRVGRIPAAAAPVGGELSAEELDANFSNLRVAAQQLDAEKLNVDAAPAITATATPANGDEFILLRGGVPYRAPVDPLLVIGEGGSGGGDSLPVDVVAIAPGQEVAVVVNGVWRRAPIDELINAAYPAPLGLWDHWTDWRAASGNANAPGLFAGAAISSGTNTTALPTGGMAGYNDHGVFLRSSTTADGGYRYQTTSLVGMYFGGVARKFRCQFLWRTSFTGRTVRTGFLDNNTVADAVDGAYFEISGSTCSAKTANNSTRTTHATTITLSLDVAYTFDIEVNAAASEARFRVWGGTDYDTALMDVTITTNIPTTSARAFGAGIVATESSTTASDIGILYGLGMGTPAAFARVCGVYSPPVVLPSAFTAGQWAVAAAEGGIDLNITALPSAGSAAITAIRYRLDGGAPVTLAGTGTGPRSITGLTGGQAYRVQLQLVTSAGGGQWSDTRTVTPTSASGSTAPAAFTAGQWTAAATASPGEVEFNLAALPSDGGSAITALEYRVAAGAAIAFVGTGTGARVVTAGLTAGVAADLQVRAVNAIGAGAWSDTKTVTPLAGGGGGAAAYLGETYTAAAGGTAEVTLPAGVTASDTVTAIAFSALGGAPATMAAPAGWTERTGVVNPSEGRGARVFTAPGNVSTLTFSASQLAGVLVFATSAPIRNHDLIGVDYSGPGATGANRETPAVTAVADDLGVSVYLQYDDGTAGAMVDPGAPQAGWTREFFKNDLAPWISVLSRASLTAGSTGTVVHDSNGAFSGRFVFTGTFGAP